MKFILGTAGMNRGYDSLAKSLDLVYETFGKDTVIDTGHGYMFNSHEDNAEVFIGKWIKDNGLKPNEDVKVIDKVGLWYDENADGERKIIPASQVFEEMQTRLGFMPETVLIHALKDIRTIRNEKYLELAEQIEANKDIKESGFSAHMQFNELLVWMKALKQYSKQKYAMLPYSILSDVCHITTSESGNKVVTQSGNPYGIEVWPNCTKEGFVAAKGFGYETIIMMPHEQGKIKQINNQPLFLNWCLRFACNNEFADAISTSSANIDHLKEDIAIVKGEWYHPTNKEGLRDKIIAESEELGNR